MVVGVGVVQPAGDAEAFVELVHVPVGGDPLVAVFGATVAAVFDFALPVGVAGGAPAVEGDGLAVDVAAIDIGQVAVLQGEARSSRRPDRNPRRTYWPGPASRPDPSGTGSR